MLRSTKAGAETPATRSTDDSRGLPSTVWCAQRRPEPRPRRHRIGQRVPVWVAERSTKAGAETPATPRILPEVGTLLRALNEGRSRDPGDTRTCREYADVQIPFARSTKAGAETPATRVAP